MLSESQKAHARRISIIEGSAATVWGQFTGGFGGNSYLTGFFLWLGASPFMMSIYGALIPLASVFQPFLLVLTRRSTSRKKLIIFLALAARPTFLALALISFVSAGLRVPMALLLFFVIEVIISSSGPLWQSWMSEVVDQSIRGKYFGTRNFIAGLIAVPSTILAGYTLDILGSGFIAFLTIFAIGSFFGAIDVYVLTRQDEDESERVPTINIPAMFEVLRLPGDFRKFLSALILWTFSVAIIGPYTTVMMINRFHFDYATLGILTVVSTLLGAFSQPLWGKLGDRYGPFRMLKFAVFFQSLLALGWAFALPSMYYMIPFEFAIGVVAVAGTTLMAFNSLMNLVPSFGKTEAFSLYSSLTNVASFGGNIVSGFLLLIFSFTAGNFLVWDLNPYRFIFFISFLARFLAFYFISKMKLDMTN